MTRAFYLVFLVLAAARSESSRICNGNECRVDNIDQNSIDHPNAPVSTYINDGSSEILLDCDFFENTMNITVVAPEATETRIFFEPADVAKYCPPNAGSGVVVPRPKNFVQLRFKPFYFNQTTAQINLTTGNFEFAKNVCIVQQEPHISGTGYKPYRVKLNAACCLEPECIPHPIIIPILNITIGICKTDEWEMESVADGSDRHSSFTVKPKPSTATDDPNGPIQYLKTCTVSSQSANHVAIVQNGKLQYQDILQSTGTYDYINRIFDFDFLTFVPSASNLPIDWLSNDNSTCPLISCQFGYCTRDGSSTSACSDFYQSTSGEVWNIKSA